MCLLMFWFSVLQDPKFFILHFFPFHYSSTKGHIALSFWLFFFFFTLSVVCHTFKICGLIYQFGKFSFITSLNNAASSFFLCLYLDSNLHFCRFYPRFIPYVLCSLLYINHFLCQPGCFLWITLPLNKLTSVTDFFIICLPGG